MIRIVIADDHQLFSQGLASLLADLEQIEIINSVDNGDALLNYLKGAQVDLVIMDINMPILDGIEATIEIKKEYPHTKILILSMYNKEAYVRNAMDAGADGYILKNFSKTELVFSIKEIMSGKTFYAQEVTQSLVRGSKLNGLKNNISLSPKENEILQLLSDGLTSNVIADKVCLGVSTVQTYRMSLLNKFEAKNVSELIKKSIFGGYIKH